MSVRKSSHGTIFLIVSSGSPRALIASSLRSTSKKPFCPMTRSLHPPMTAHDHRVRFVATWREEFFEVPLTVVGLAAQGEESFFPTAWRERTPHGSTFNLERRVAHAAVPRGGGRSYRNDDHRL